ncbi:hypothetical protein B6D52_01250 [Candidatus Parcubacteria bacterium 4484_255]|nr:MAG: hypothetical protein B6D52_01250 [Candidatus Parcubacteria bacterium 4484_255]
MRILIIDSKESLGIRAITGIEILRMKSISENDLETIAKLSPDLIFLAFRFPGWATPVDSVCLQGPQILPLLWKYVPGVAIVGLGNWESIEGINKKDLSGIETQERFRELFKEFLS